MDYQNMPSTLLLQILFFIAWSVILYGFALAITKILPHLAKWSRFWQAWLLVALVPLFPDYFYQVNTLIPDALKEAFSDSQHNLLNHSNSVVNQIESTETLQIFLSLVIVMIIGGCCLSLLRFFSGVLKVNKFVKQATPLIDFKHFTQQQKTVITTNNIRVRITSQPVSPFVFGFFQVTMLLPSSVFNMSQQQRFLLIEHELMHIKRWDPKAVIIFRFCSSIFWFNPVISFFERQFLQSMELNCDMAVISSYPKVKLDYARALVASLKLSKNTIDNGLTTYFSGPQLKKQDFENRIKTAMSAHLNNKYDRRYISFLLFLSSFMCFFVIAVKPFFPVLEFNSNSFDGMLPVLNARVSSGYGDINDFRGYRPHKAIDFAAPIGTKVVASFSGKVLIADNATLHRNYGKVVLVEHKGQMQSLYAHLDSFSVESGQYISAGQTLGTVGETGRVTGPHLHFELLKAGKPIDPALYLNLQI
ncbi:M23/M56 family metallopeptidase [Pseudoalteromonas denitrificans]|uniref:Peptidase family M23 n=1 Tax=Pseudoalteromonas denitrificans DSM 6059 TaxID=1123010 RepID=A0A1I1IQP6_9GAMM|nr:M23/M56 family metallopeptidase [Pseudoalteromonas denitrificans]SFC36063.1 Peptidase family M23 [Pseudoalteromonas denitrificans DSM 6059]